MKMLILASALLLSSLAASAAPIEPVLESFVGRFFLTETEEGAAIAERALGRRITSQSDYAQFLERARNGGLSDSDAGTLENRVNGINDRVGADSRPDAELYGLAKAAARESGLTLIHPDADLGSIEFFPAAGEVPSEALRNEFLNGSGVSPARLESTLQRSITRIDSRADEWIRNRQCVSCHSVHPFTAARAGTPDWQNSPLARVKTFIEGRLGNWDNAAPWYHGQADNSRSAELILSLSTLSHIEGSSAEIRTALGKLAALQQADGGFPWLDFRLQPWESTEGKIYGNAQALEALTRVSPELEAEYATVIAKLRGYLRAQAGLSTTSLWNKLALLGADTRSPGILTEQQRADIIQSMLNLQLQDGGWSLNHLSSWRKQGNAAVAVDSASDGYATAYALYTLRHGGLLTSAEWDLVRPAWQKGIDWLTSNQAASGGWASASLNRDNPFNHGLIEDAATAYGSLALQAARGL